jgi:hypothetical protein
MPPYSSDTLAVDNGKAQSNGAAVTAASDVTLSSSEQQLKSEDAYTQMGHTSDVLCIAWYVTLCFTRCSARTL